MASPLDAFMPAPDVRERFHTTICAPVDVVMHVAANFDMQSPPAIRAIFRMRELLMRAHPPPRIARGLLEEMEALGWTPLLRRRGLLIYGAACKPWEPRVRFKPVPLEDFAAYGVPDEVKIAWTIEADALTPATTRFSHETRAVATDHAARTKFLRYWRWARFGIVAIRVLWLPTIRREAERRWARNAPQDE